MGIQVEFNPDLALRAYNTSDRKCEECLPRELKAESTHRFIKNGQRNYWLEGEIPLLETNGNQILSRPLASIRILEATHLLLGGKPCTIGLYKIIEVYDAQDPKIHFEGMNKIPGSKR